MPSIKSTTKPLTRHACEPCRRKKTKCTAERPICSYCKRLGDQCHYLPRGQPKSDPGRLRRRLTRRTTSEDIQPHTEIISSDLLGHTDHAVESENPRSADQPLHDIAPFTFPGPDFSTPGTLDFPSAQQTSDIFSTTK
ncbi:uncharacterized protein B0J16DRAFT_147075 [Fusarium flagelliforme]|uniref:uncharacterized protein n=1 Tax=Fusarium flagelliforme TaxID=2675880 RepID=UPI001E8E5D04|nr:uncharacterized protein B0J16DRAFT_147075 [Fusarium flagelliforme]KAH7186241.1 hypothetical protein B0J16DRAFT_147075 [Fusarium flagelliforme]